jgi:hypothetical protein
MKYYIIKELRKLSFVPGREKTWISKLADDQLYSIYQRLANGETARSIATSIKEQWGINPHSSTHAIGQGVLTFKKRISHMLLNLPKPEGDYSSLFVPESLENLTSLERLEIKARQFEERITKIMENEKQTGKFYPYLSRDIQAMASLRKAIIKERDWQNKHPDPLIAINDEKRRQVMERRFGLFMDTLGPEGQARIVNASERFLEAVEKRAVNMRFNEKTGKYQRIPDEELNQEESQP